MLTSIFFLGDLKIVNQNSKKQVENDENHDEDVGNYESK